MKFEAVLVKVLDDQMDRDGHKIDPAGVKFDPEAEVPIWREFNYDIEKDLLGHGRISRAADGSLMVRGELTPEGEGFVNKGLAKLAIGIRVDKQHLVKNRGSVIPESSLMSIGMTWTHQDPAQPVIRILDEL